MVRFGEFPGNKGLLGKSLNPRIVRAHGSSESATSMFHHEFRARERINPTLSASEDITIPEQLSFGELSHRLAEAIDRRLAHPVPASVIGEEFADALLSIRARQPNLLLIKRCDLPPAVVAASPSVIGSLFNLFFTEDPVSRGMPPLPDEMVDWGDWFDDELR